MEVEAVKLLRSSLYSFLILRLRSSVSSMSFNERSFWNTSDEAISCNSICSLIVNNALFNFFIDLIILSGFNFVKNYQIDFYDSKNKSYY